MMLAKSFVLALVPSSTNEKLDSGKGDAVNEKEAGPLGVASLTTVIEPGKRTASADSERSWLPPDPSRAISRVWYGEPEMATAELLAPQSARLEMWPPQARTGLATLVVKVTVMRADLSPAKPLPPSYEYPLTAVIVPPYSVKLPPSCVIGAPSLST